MKEAHTILEAGNCVALVQSCPLDSHWEPGPDLSEIPDSNKQGTVWGGITFSQAYRVLMNAGEIYCHSR